MALRADSTKDWAGRLTEIAASARLAHPPGMDFMKWLNALGVVLDDGTLAQGKQKIDGGPSVLYDAVALLVTAEGAARLARDGAARDFVADAFGHLKFIGYTPEAMPLLAKAGIADADMDEALVQLEGAASAKAFLDAAWQLRFWEREFKVDLDAEAFLENNPVE